MGADPAQYRRRDDAGMAHVLIIAGPVTRRSWRAAQPGMSGCAATCLAKLTASPKTPDWAAEVTGVPADDHGLARDCAALPNMLTANWSLQRAELGEQPYWMLVALASMLGRDPPAGTGRRLRPWQHRGDGRAARGIALGGACWRCPIPRGRFIPVARITEMLEKPGGEFRVQRRSGCGYPDIRMICWAGGNPYHHHQDLNRFLHAWARAETIIVHEPWWTAAAQRADIVLPARQRWSATTSRHPRATGSCWR